MSHDDARPGGPAEPATDRAESVHDLIQKEIAEMLANADLSDEEKQQILVAMRCPCCGAGGVSLSLKLGGRPKDRPSF